MKYILIILCGLFMACSNTIPSTVIVPDPVAPTESVSPSIDKVDNSNQKLRASIQKQEQIIRQQKEEIDEALALADKIKENIKDTYPAAGVDSANLLVSLNKIKSRNLFLEEENTSLNKINDSQKTEIADALEKSRLSEEEKIKLRNAIKVLEPQLNKVAKERDSAITERDRAIKSAASSKVYKNWVIGLIAGFVGWVIIKNILMIYFPATKFRI